jgi:hypothetical protein
LVIANKLVRYSLVTIQTCPKAWPKQRIKSQVLKLNV